MARRQVGEILKYECKIDGVLHWRYVSVDERPAPIPPDVVFHFEQRGEGHVVTTVHEPMFEDGAPTFTKGNRVILESEKWMVSWTPLKGTVIGTLVDDDGVELTGYINDMGNLHLECAKNLVEIEGW